MSTPAPGIERQSVLVGEHSLEHVRTVAELARLSASLNQNGYAFSLDEDHVRLTAQRIPTRLTPETTAVIELLPIDTAGDSSLRLITFDFCSTVSDPSTRRDAVTSALAIIAAHLPLGSLWIDATSVHLSYTLAVDALQALRDDVVVDVAHLLGRLFEQSRGYVHAVVEGEIGPAELERLMIGTGAD